MYITIDDTFTVELLSSVATSETSIVHTIRVTCIADMATLDIELPALNCNEKDCKSLDLTGTFVGSCEVGVIYFGNSDSCSCGVVLPDLVCPKNWINGPVIDPAAGIVCDWESAQKANIIIQAGGTQYTCDSTSGAAMEKQSGIIYREDMKVRKTWTTQTAPNNNGPGTQLGDSNIAVLTWSRFNLALGSSYNCFHTTPAFGTSPRIIVDGGFSPPFYVQDPAPQSADWVHEFEFLEYLGSSIRFGRCYEDWVIMITLTVNGIIAHTVTDQIAIETNQIISTEFFNYQNVSFQVGNTETSWYTSNFYLENFEVQVP